MLTFTLYRDNALAAAEVRLDPAEVVGVVESYRVRAGDLIPVALLTLADGRELVVEDPARDVAKRIREARGERVDS
jgi:hypothetical protein